MKITVLLHKLYMYFYSNINSVTDKEHFLANFAKSLWQILQRVCALLSKMGKKLNKITEGVCIVYNVYLFEQCISQVNG